MSRDVRAQFCPVQVSRPQDSQLETGRVTWGTGNLCPTAGSWNLTKVLAGKVSLAIGDVSQ